MQRGKQQSAKDIRKPIKAQDRIPPKRIESAQDANKRRIISAPLQDGKPYTSRENDQLKDRLNNIVQDYLLRCNYLNTLEQFEQDLYATVIPEQDTAYGLILQAFDQGQKEQFFMHWNKYIPPKDQDYEFWKLEFNLQIYFLILPIHPSSLKGQQKNKAQPQIDPQAVNAFKQFLETKGKINISQHEIKGACDFSKSSDVLPYFALPYVKQPQTHSSFTNLFQPQWINSLREKVKNFLQTIFGDSKESMLKRLYLGNQKGHVDVELQDYAERLGSINKLQQTEILELKQRLNSQTLAIKKLNENAQSNLYETQQKWFQFSRDMAMVTKDVLKSQQFIIQLLKMIDNNIYNQLPFSEQKIDHLRKKISQYEKFLNSNIDDLMSQSQDISLFEKASIVDQDQSNVLAYNPNLAHIQSQNQTSLQQQNQQSAEKFEQQSRESQLVPLDYGKIIKLFSTSNNNILISSVLQALRWRLTRARSSYERRSVVVAYATHDIVGTHQRNIALAQFLLLKTKSVKVQEFTLKLMNALASDFSGRSYLTQSGQLVKFLLEIIKKENGDTIKRRNSITTLQKLSLRRDAQIWMIEHDLVQQILLILRNEKDTLSEYCYEYITAMLMNLSLRGRGKDKLEECKELAFEVLLKLLDCRNDQIRTFINGTLYSLLSRRSLQQYAHSINFMETLQNMHDDSEERFQKQIQYMLQQLQNTKNDEDLEETVQSEQLDENDVDDIEDDEECAAEEDDDDDQIAELSEQMVVGEELLVKEFALTGPEGEQVIKLFLNFIFSKKQKFITDSIVLKELQQRSLLQQRQQEIESEQDFLHDDSQQVDQLPPFLQYDMNKVQRRSIPRDQYQGPLIIQSLDQMSRQQIIQQPIHHSVNQQNHLPLSQPVYQHANKQQKQQAIQQVYPAQQPQLHSYQQPQQQRYLQQLQPTQQQYKQPPTHQHTYNHSPPKGYQLPQDTNQHNQQIQAEDELIKQPVPFVSRPKIPRTPPVFPDGQK